MKTWKIIGYDKLNNDGKIHFAIDIIVKAGTEKLALSKAKKIVERKNYYAQYVTELEDLHSEILEKFLTKITKYLKK